MQQLAYISKTNSLLGISSFVNVDQDEIYQLAMYNLMTSKLFSIRAPRKIYHFGFALFSENAQGARSGTHLFCNLEDQQSAVHPKNSMCMQILGYAKIPVSLPDYPIK